MQKDRLLDTLFKRDPRPPGEAADGASTDKRPDFTAGSRVLVMMGVAVLVAIGTVIVGIIMLRLIELITNLIYFGRFSFTYIPFGQSPLGWLAAFIPIAGSIVIGFMARYGTNKIRGHGIPEAIEAILLDGSRLDAKVAVLKPTSAVVAIGTGGPFGAEGPIIMTGGAIGSLIAQALPMSDVERKTLLVAGAAAGMTVVFGTPIAAIMLGVELLLFEWRARSFLPVATACIVAAVLRMYTGFAYPLFPFTGSVAYSLSALGWWVIVGICCGLLSCVLTRMVYFCEDTFRKVPVHWMWWPALGGIVVGVGGLIAPDALGLGYANIAQLLHGTYPLDGGLRLFIVKAIIWAVALASGTSGGTFAPLMLIGGSVAAAATSLLPHASPGFWSVLAMAAVLGGTLRLPLTAIFFAVGVTGNEQVLLPLLATCGTTYAVVVLLMRHDILTEKVARRGTHVTREWDADPFSLTRVGDVMARDVQTVSGAMSLSGISNFLLDSEARHPSFPVIDDARHVLGIVDPPMVLAWRSDGVARDATLAELLSPLPKPAVAYPDEYLDGLVKRMMGANVAHMPVVTRDGSVLIGYVAWKDLLRVRTRMQEEERRPVVTHRGRKMHLFFLPSHRPEPADRTAGAD